MKITMNILVLLLSGMVVTCCGIKDRRAVRIHSQYPQWDQATVQTVAAGKVTPGMTKPMVMEALGAPDTTSQEPDEEKWSYGINKERDMGAIVRRQVFWVYFKGEEVVRTAGDWRKLGYSFYGW